MVIVLTMLSILMFTVLTEPPTDYRCGIDNVAKERFNAVLHAGDNFNVRIFESCIISKKLN